MTEQTMSDLFDEMDAYAAEHLHDDLHVAEDTRFFSSGWSRRTGPNSAAKSAISCSISGAKTIWPIRAPNWPRPAII